MLAKETRWKSLGAIPEELYLFLEFGADVNVSLRYTGVIGESGVIGDPFTQRDTS